MPVGDDDGAFVLVFAVPAVQLDAAAATQQDLKQNKAFVSIKLNILDITFMYLSVNLHTGLPSKLPPGEIRVVTGVDIVVGEGLIHVLVDVQTVQEDGRVLVGHQVVGQTLLAQLL